MKDLKPIKQEAKVTEHANEEQPRLGQWFWVTETCGYDEKKSGRKKGDTYEWLGCVMKIGSNFVEMHSPHDASGHGGSSRVHFDEYYTRLRPEPNADAVIQKNIQYYQQESNRLIEEVKRVSARLGLKPTLAIPGAEAEESSTALAVMSGQADVKAYETALVKAKEETLPALFKEIKEANEELTRWMLATTMETQAIMVPMKATIGEVANRIFNVSLYAGLTENVVQCCDGEPAEMLEKLHVMQRRCYMDEECLLDYQAGGMEFKNIEEFDAWITEPANRDRILPFPRTLVAMRVRRAPEERDNEGSLLKAFINIELEYADKLTFLYIRNGEQVWRMSCDLDFGEMIFPDKSLYDPGQPMMVKMFGTSIDKMITVRDYEERVKEYKEDKRLEEEWTKANPDKSWIHNPHRSNWFHPFEWKPFDPSNVYFDECMAKIEAEVKQYNRIALIIQGLYDRSGVLHPHPPVRTWVPEGFDRAIKLVFDGATTLYHGEAPDFEAYRVKCNASLSADSVVTGQEEFWIAKETEKEHKRLDNDWRNRSDYRPKRYKPYGDPGPGVVSQMSSWLPRKRQAIFTWYRDRRDWSSYDTSPVKATITVPAEELFNISAYKPGDFLQFFQDPRTREKYLKWAPFLLTAEDYHAGKIIPKDSV